MRSYTLGLLQSYKSDLDDQIDEGFWLWYMLSTWLRQVVDELMHIHEVYSWWCLLILMSHSLCVFDAWLVHIFCMVDALIDGTYLGIGWCMVDALVDGIGWGTGWCMVDALVYGTWWLHVVCGTSWL